MPAPAGDRSSHLPHMLFALALGGAAAGVDAVGEGGVVHEPITFGWTTTTVGRSIASGCFRVASGKLFALGR